MPRSLPPVTQPPPPPPPPLDPSAAGLLAKRTTITTVHQSAIDRSPRNAVFLHFINLEHRRRDPRAQGLSPLFS
jgi:hypothetical protein